MVRLQDGANLTNLNIIIIYMKQLLHYDQLRAVQFKCNTSAKYTSIMITVITIALAQAARAISAF